MPWAIAGNIAIVGMLLAASYAAQGSAIGWFFTAALLLVFLAVAGRLGLWLIELAKQKLRWRQEFEASGKVRISLRESLAGRMAADGGTTTAAAFAWFCLKTSLKWSAALMAMLAIGAFTKAEFGLIQQHIVTYAAAGAALGLIAGVLIQLIGRRLKIVEGSHISIEVPGTRTKVWQLSELADSEITVGPEGYSAIRLRFADKGSRSTELRLIARVQAEVADDLRRLLDREQTPVTGA